MLLSACGIGYLVFSNAKIHSKLIFVELSTAEREKEMTVFDEAYLTVVNFIQTYGWRIVFAFLAIYIIYPYVMEYWIYLQDTFLRDRNRERILDKDCSRIRFLQQSAHEKLVATKWA